MSNTISPNNNHAARKVSSLRQRMIDDMTVRNLSAQTQASYVQYVSQLARYFDRSPEKISVEDIRTFLLYLANEKGLSRARGMSPHTRCASSSWSRFVVPGPSKLFPQRKEKAGCL